MKAIVLYRKDQKMSEWSGGTTTELFIYPDGATYEEKNFHFRISTAEVEMKTSTFTSLPGYARRLMVLKGSIEISHKDHHSKKLEMYDQDAFSGDWETTSVGTCTDFNLICSPKTSGSFHHFQLEKLDEMVLSSTYSFQFIYVVQGSIEVTIERKIRVLTSCDFLIVKEPNSVKLAIRSLGSSVFIETNVNY